MTTAYNTATGQVDWVEDPEGRRTSFSYDPLSGQKISETNALGKVTRFTYSPRGEVTNIWGDVPYPVRYIFDNYGRLSQMHTWRSGTSWDAAAFPTSMEAQKDVTTWNYQEATGLLTSKTDAAGQSSAYTYTPEGKLKTRTWARINGGSPTVTTYGYDADTGELTSIDYSNLTPDVTLTYDRLGRQKTITDALGNRTFGYNAKLQPETENITGLYNKLLTRSYAASGVLGRLNEFNTGAGYSVTYGYDAVGRFNSVGWNVSGQTGSGTYNFVPNSDLLQSLTTPSGLTTSLSYEPHRDLKTQVKNQFGAATLSQYDYAYDSLGRRNLVKNSGSAFVSPAFNKFDYNLRNELSESARYLGADVSVLTNPVLGEYRHFDYDPIGNRGNITVAGNTGSYSANNRNQYLSALLPAGGTNNFTHDTDGNLTEISGSQNVVYAYDAENRLISAEPKTPVVNDKKIELTYDYQGRRVRKIVSQYNGSAWIVAADKRFVYDGWNLIEEQTLSPASSRFYVWGLDLSQSLQGAGGIGGLLATVSGSTTDHFLYDGNGNVGQLVNASGGVIDAQYEYDPYGNLILSTGTLSASNPFRFSTKYLDTETGLYYYGYRYYDSNNGRWLNRDPYGEQEGINLYAFNQNNLINLTDLLGLTVNWHHLLPQSLFTEYISNGKITEISLGDIHDPKYGWMLDPEEHKIVHGKSQVFEDWNKNWEGWIKRQKGTITKERIHKRLAYLIRKSQYNKIFKTGVRATVKYTSWDGVRTKAYQEIKERVLKQLGKQAVEKGAKKGTKQGFKSVPLIGWGAAAVFFACDLANSEKSLASAVQSNIPYYGVAYDIFEAYQEFGNADSLIEKELTHNIYTKGIREPYDFGEPEGYSDGEFPNVPTP